MFAGEPPGDQHAGQVDERVNPVQQARSRVVGPPFPFVRSPVGPANEVDHLVAAAGEKRGQGRADQAGAAGDGDGERAAELAGPLVRG